MISEIAIRESFAKAKKDIKSNSVRIEELERENKELRTLVYNLNDAISNSAKEEIEDAEEITAKNGNIKAAIREALNEMNVYSEKTKDDITRFNLTKKDIIKSKILEIAEMQNIMLPKLKEAIVDNNKYCSKASFYRYFDELKNEGRISIISINNKSIVRSNRIEITPEIR